MLINISSNLKLLTLFLVVNHFSSTFAWKDLQLNRLLDCLKKEGVSSENVHLRTSGKYADLNFQWNTLYGLLTPLVYLVATSVSDIQKAVICSQSSGIRIVPRSGGHSYIKACFGDSRSLIVDLTTLNGISVDKERMTCELGPGAKNGLITYKLWEHGFLVSQGVCPSVGVSGLTLGGGYGHFSRLLGLTSDNVVEMEMVDAKGKLLVANNSTNKDLFWALRGGGGGNFGIVSKFKFKMYRAPESIIQARYQFSLDDFTQAYTAWQNLIGSRLPNNIFGFMVMKDTNIRLGVYSFNGPNHLNLKPVSADDLKKLVISSSFPTSTNTSIRVMTHTEFLVNEGQRYSTSLSHPSDLATLTRHNRIGWKKVKSMYVHKVLNKFQIWRLGRIVKTYLKRGGYWGMEICGGAIDFLAPSSTAFVHRRKHSYIIQLSSESKERDLNIDAASKKLYAATRLLLNHQESYQNYLDADMPNYLKRYYGTNLERLKNIKTAIDPENVFHHPQSIPSKKWK